jgi:hypothetical protein
LTAGKTPALGRLTPMSVTRLKKQLRVDWGLPDPRDRPVERVRAMRGGIIRRVQRLLDELDATVAYTA